MDRRGNGAIGRGAVLVALLGPGAREASSSLKRLSSSDLLVESNDLVHIYLSRIE